ncbi:hypothetical protein BKA93DRAFT_825710 [Sparassis latifolia]|uniref:Uncharacterized protein n=1 Tax=Sparassis crispa TaxID=139825 RepID=A0A401GWD7_9APHY|nr:hypothetical protein SCP_0904100 [Sparassis crispa]GBE86531.1 hypothetical protein SCP_0904100 [Sparassis crispa]
MTDLTFCYLHMTRHDLDILDTIGTPDYLQGELSDSEVDVPRHMAPPNPDDSDVLPSQVHPSYPYGNPLNVKHPAARPRRPYDPSSRALFEDMGYAGGGVNGSLRWKDLALELLIPVDEARELAERAALARKLASGASSNHPPPPPLPLPAQEPNNEDEVEDEDNDENENDENDEEDNGENHDDSSPEEDDASLDA